MVMVDNIWLSEACEYLAESLSLFQPLQVIKRWSTMG